MEENFKKYVISFLEKLEIYEDLYNKEYKKIISESIINFIELPTVDSAYTVYETFFTAYWIGTQRKENPFLKLIEKVKRFEELGGRLTPNQRDHFLHSVFVFLLGLGIYEQNCNYRASFERYALNKKSYPDSYDTKNEEFFYRWGIASLFHDIAYPLEITLKQINRYANFICSYPEIDAQSLEVKLQLCNFEEFTKLPLIKPNTIYEEGFSSKYPNYKEKFHSDAMAILSESIAFNFNLNFNDVNKKIRQFVRDMDEGNFIDHGFYSSIIILRWYHYLINSTSWNPAYFYIPIADAASAIFLHNYFEHGLMDSFKLEPLKAEIHPIAYLLILCDHLQEWKRECYGEESLKKEYPTDFDLVVNNSTMEVSYKFSKYYSNMHDFSELRTKIYKLLNVYDIFEKDVQIN